MQTIQRIAQTHEQFSWYYKLRKEQQMTLGRSSESAIAIMFMEEKLRNGHVIRIPSVGVILTAKDLGDKTEAKSPTIEEIKEALEECLTAQWRLLEKAEDAEERERITKSDYRS